MVGNEGDIFELILKHFLKYPGRLEQKRLQTFLLQKSTLEIVF